MTDREQAQTLEIERPSVAGSAVDAQTPRFSSAPAISLAMAGCTVMAAVLASALLSGRAGAADWMTRTWPFVNLAICVGLITALITVARVHAFLALIISAVAAGMISGVGTLPGEPAMNHWIAAVELVGVKLGVTAGKIGIVIALASIIGMSLLESGAADRIVRWFLGIFGEPRAGLALLVSTYVISIPIFFDTVFLLLIPLLHALCRRTGKDYVLYLAAVSCAAGITHSLVIPHPGPLAAAASLGVDPGLSILLGLLAGLPPLAVSWLLCVWLNRRLSILPAAAMKQPGDDDGHALRLPSLGVALLPIAAPLGLIWIASLAALARAHLPAPLAGTAEFFGHRYVALFIGAVASLGVLMRQRGLTLGQLSACLGPPLETAGIIILITSAGGAFGASLESAGIGKAIESAAAGKQINLIVLAWLVAMVIRVAQGSVTVAIITASAIMAPMAAGALPYHPVYLFLAVGYGALFVSWMNDSGFWVISRVGGLSEKQTVMTWTFLSGAIALAGLAVTLILSRLLPLAPH